MCLSLFRFYLLLFLFVVNFNISAAEQKEAVKSLDDDENEKSEIISYAEGYKDNDHVLLSFSGEVRETFWSTLCPNGYAGYFETVRLKSNSQSFSPLEEGISATGDKLPCLFFDFNLKCFEPILSALQHGKNLFLKPSSEIHEVASHLGYESYFNRIYQEKLTLLVVKGVRFDFVKIKAGKYMMGSPESEKGRYKNEKRRLVEVKEFLMGKCPVTQEQYKAVMGKNPSHFKGDKLPVEGVSYNDAETFVATLNSLLEKKGFSGNIRLPSEEEWEYAARGGTTTAYWWGDEISEEHCWYEENSNRSTREVGAVGHENPYGLSDMLGNVYECTTSRSSEYYDLGKIVVRGGSCYSPFRFIRSAFRDYSYPNTVTFNIGFRLARSP